MNAQAITITLTAQETILRACTHPTGRADIWINKTEAVCSACWNLSVAARRAERKAKLAQRPKDCVRCGLRPHTWIYGNFRLCGRCHTATRKEHARASATAGLLAIFATAPLVDTSAWAGRTGGQEMSNQPDPIFGEVISSYSRAQALEDGELVDVSETAREAGITFPVALTRAVWETCCEWTAADAKAKHEGQSVRGRLWDVVSMLRFAIRTSAGTTPLLYRLSRIPRPGHGAKRLVTLKAVCGPGDTAEPVITIMLPEED